MLSSYCHRLAGSGSRFVRTRPGSAVAHPRATGILHIFLVPARAGKIGTFLQAFDWIGVLAARRHVSLPCAAAGCLNGAIRCVPGLRSAGEWVMNPYVIPVGAIVAGVLVLLMPRLLNYIVALALIAYGLYELNKVHAF